MGLQLRVSLPDQPGALSRVTRAIARAGADVISVAALESDGGRATDEFRLRWPDAKDHAVLLAFLGLVPVVVPLPFMVLGLMVCVIQTLVFVLLSMIYIALAVQEAHHDDHAHEHAEHGAHAHA